LFDPGGVLIHVGRNVVDVQFQGVSASFSTDFINQTSSAVLKW
jgi:hypothetical protein